MNNVSLIHVAFVQLFIVIIQDRKLQFGLNYCVNYHANYEYIYFAPVVSKI